jgi:hypothetical protein
VRKAFRLERFADVLAARVYSLLVLPVKRQLNSIADQPFAPLGA